MAIAQKKSHIAVEEYLQFELAAVEKCEYFDGEISAMAGDSIEHALIATNAAIELGSCLRGKQYVPYAGDLRLEISPTGLFTYPDISVICGRVERSSRDHDTATNPTLIVEVLSSSTEAYDRGATFAHYRTLPSFHEYVLISQHEPLVEVFFRLPDGTWRLTPVNGLDAEAPIESLGITLRLAEVYANVEFPERPPLKPAAA